MGVKTGLLNCKFQFQENPNSWALTTFIFMKSIFSSKNPSAAIILCPW